MNKIDISVIIVNYNVKDDLIDCLNSIFNSKQKVKFEVIVVDNSEKEIGKELKKRFSKVEYIKSEKNLGYGGGNNLGAKKAAGEYLFILNPDTKIFNGTLDSLYNFLVKNKKTGITSPVIMDDKQDFFEVQGTKELTPTSIIFSHSFLRKLLPKKNILNELKFSKWNMKNPREVEEVPGAALMINKKLFEEVKRFDENLFLYFEENDISKKVRNLGYKLFIIPNSKIIHKVARSTGKILNIEKIYKRSRFLFFKKHYGILKAFCVEAVLSVNKFSVSIFLILGTALFLRLVNLSKSMIFIGDQGWFYLSARDMLLTGRVPLVGITSSHTWLHQGPLWTYLLSFALKVSNFNPLSGAYLTAFIGVLTVFLMYKIGSQIFSKKVGFIAALLYATSPLIIYSDRIPFDPTPIPFFTVLYFYALFKWIKGSINFFPSVLFLIFILYNLELASFTLFSILILYFVLGFWKNKQFVKKLKNKKIILYSSLAFLVPMLPVLIYDTSHGFKQTIVFLGWTLYKPISFIFNYSSSNFKSGFGEIINFLLLNIQKIVLAQSLIISFLIFLTSIICLLYLFYKSKFSIFNGNFLLLIILSISILGILVNQVPSDAYLPIIFPFVVFVVAIFVNFLFYFKKTKFIALLLLSLIVVLNTRTSYINSQNDRFSQRLNAVDRIIKLSDGENYNLLGVGLNSQFESFTMNYEYLLWWKGHVPSKNNEKIKIFISENEKNISVEKLKN